MQIVQREFYRSFRGPSPKDEDVWRLAFDYATKRLTVCHEWDVGRHSGVDEFDIAEFLAQEGAPQTALIDEPSARFRLMNSGLRGIILA